MDLTRRDFLAAAAGACGACLSLGGCAATNPAPLFTAFLDGTLPMPEPLKMVGGQVKVKVPYIEDTVLVWRDLGGLHAASIVCTHRYSEVAYNEKANTLDCPSHGSRFNPDGSVLNGPAKRPLRVFKATQMDDKLKIES